MTISTNATTTGRTSFRAGAAPRRPGGFIAHRPYPTPPPASEYRRVNALYGWPELVEAGPDEAALSQVAAAEPDDRDPLAEEIFDLAVLEVIHEHAPTIEVVLEIDGHAGKRP